ncbi:MAG: hypothetical protein DHS20C13_16690 [Thermodesulfobacteriota bacterium]|nr:MAG: hypothetical protein DHS20C13_16690 [Thermodesulfobacteriota bacterium]
MSIEERIKKVLLENALKDIDPKEIRNSSQLIEFGVGLDSVATLELVVALEEEFQIRIDESDISAETFQTINSMALHITEKL